MRSFVAGWQFVACCARGPLGRILGMVWSEEWRVENEGGKWMESRASSLKALLALPEGLSSLPPGRVSFRGLMDFLGSGLSLCML